MELSVCGGGAACAINTYIIIYSSVVMSLSPVYNITYIIMYNSMLYSVFQCMTVTYKYVHNIMIIIHNPVYDSHI